MASTPDPKDARIDPDDVYLWRMPSRRMEAELVRDNILYVSGHRLDETLPEGRRSIPHWALRRAVGASTCEPPPKSKARSVRYSLAPSVTECYARKPSVVPQQALALANSELAIGQAQILADLLTRRVGDDDGRFVQEAFLRTLARRPTPTEAVKICTEFVYPANGASAAVTVTAAPGKQADTVNRNRKRMNLILVLFNDSDFVTIR